MKKLLAACSVALLSMNTPALSDWDQSDPILHPMTDVIYSTKYLASDNYELAVAFICMGEGNPEIGIHIQSIVGVNSLFSDVIEYRFDKGEVRQMKLNRTQHNFAVTGVDRDVVYQFASSLVAAERLTINFDGVLDTFEVGDAKSELAEFRDGCSMSDTMHYGPQMS